MNRKVLVFAEYGVLNGGENSFLTIAGRIIDHGWQLAAAVPVDSPFESRLIKFGVPNVGLELYDADGVRKPQAEIREHLKQIMQTTHPAILHCNSLSMARLVGPVAKELGVAAVGYLRDIIKLSKQAIDDLNCLDRLIAVSQATRDWHVQQGIDDDKTIVVYNAIDTDQFHPGISTAQLDREIDLPPTHMVLLFIGQIGIRKGIDTLLSIFQTVQRQLPNTHLLIVGERNSEKQEAIEYEQRARKLATNISTESSRVIWLGRRTDVEVLMNRADLLVHAANQEPLGRVLLEAAACGLPIVATDVGGTREILAGMDEFKLLFPPVATQQFADRIVSLLQEAETRNVVSRRLVDIARSRFDVQRCAHKIHDIYTDLIN